MAIILQEDKYNSIKKRLDSAGKTYVQRQIAAKEGVGQATVSRVKRSKDYNDYLKQFTTGKQLKEQPVTKPKATRKKTPSAPKVMEPEEKGFMARIKSIFKK